jgi:hypothetical protein
MRVSIVDEITRHNVSLFREIMRRMRKKYSAPAENRLALSVNCRTGELAAAEEKEPVAGKQWKAILLKWNPEDHIPIEAVESKEELFTCGDLKPEALSRLAATIKILNRVAFEPKSEAAFLSAIDDLEIQQDFEDPLIGKAWMNIDREEAEKQLLDKPIGTYFFRKGEFAQVLEENLIQVSLQPVHCYTLIFSEEEGKMSERIVVLKNHKQWLFYDDDPKLQTACYLTLEALLQTMGPKLKQPLVVE